MTDTKDHGAAPDTGAQKTADPALQGFALMQLTRLIGLGAAFYGAVRVGQSIQTDILGMACLVGGSVAFFFLPRKIAQAWNKEQGNKDQDGEA